MNETVAERVWEIAEPLVTHEGLEMVDVEFRRESRGMVLRLYLDRESGVSLDDLSRVSRQLGDLLDVHDAVPGPYTLEVSSPGINRRLRRPEHFLRYLGKRVRVRTAGAVARTPRLRWHSAVRRCRRYRGGGRRGLTYDTLHGDCPGEPRAGILRGVQEVAMQPELSRVIEQVSKEKGIDRSIVINAIETAMLSAAKKLVAPSTQLEAKFNPEIGEVELFKILTVVEHVADPETQIAVDDARQNLDPEAQVGDDLLEKLGQRYGRIAAQAAKQSLIQRLRDAERDIIYNEFKDRKGELTHSGIVQRFEKKNIIVNLGRTDAILPEKEQIPRERYRQGDRIRAYILEVEMSSKGPQIVLSRTHPGFLIKLFEQEVPEVYEGIVEIKGAAREPGPGQESPWYRTTRTLTRWERVSA